MTAEYRSAEDFGARKYPGYASKEKFMGESGGGEERKGATTGKEEKEMWWLELWVGESGYITSSSRINTEEWVGGEKWMETGRMKIHRS
jgi:hypothetical protein